jgi:hypothetical protein
MATRLSLTRPQRRQSSSGGASSPKKPSTTPEPDVDRSEPARTAVELASDMAVGSASLPISEAGGAGLAVVDVNNAGAAVGAFDASVLEPFVLLEEMSARLGESVTEHVALFRQAVWLQRDFLRLVCQVTKDHSEAQRVLEETNGNLESVTLFPASLPTTSKQLPLCRAVADASEALTWILSDRTDPSFATACRERVLSNAEAVDATRVAGAAEWFGQLVAVVHGLLGVLQR